MHASIDLDFLDQIEQRLEDGLEVYACQGAGAYQWYILNSLDDILLKAKQAVDLKKYPLNVYRVISGSEVAPESYLVVKRVVISTVGEPRYEWVQVDTSDAAEQVRDITYGPTQFFGLITETVLKPSV